MGIAENPNERRNEEIENKQRDAQLAPKEANRASSYAYSRNPPANEQTEEKKQNILCVLDSSINARAAEFSASSIH